MGYISTMIFETKLPFFLLFLFCSSFPIGAQDIATPEKEKDLLSIVKSMPLDLLCGQMIMVSGYSNLDRRHLMLLKKWTKKGQIGGIIWMQGGPNRQRNIIAQLQDLSQSHIGFRLLMAQDAEWGASMRLDSVSRLPWPLTLGATQNQELAYNYGESLGAESRYLGININFSPVVDLNTNPRNPIIGQRSLGSDMTNVNKMASQEIFGIQSQKVMACAKHFPGHGDTESDSHKTLPTLTQDCKTLKRREMHPFISAIESGVEAIMVAHLNIPSLDSTGTPASISRPIVTNWLRDSLNFDGLIFTDALNMKGLSQDLPPGEIEVRAVEAGNDVLLFVADPEIAIEAIMTAVKNERISREDIESHVIRIIKSKERYASYDHREFDNKYLSDLMKRRSFLSKEIYQKANTLVYDVKNVLDSTKTSSIYLKTYTENSVNFGDKLIDTFSAHNVDEELESGHGRTIWLLNCEFAINPWESGKIPNSLLKDAKEFKDKGFKVGFVQMANLYGLINSANPNQYLKNITELFDAVIIGYEATNIAIEEIVDLILLGKKKDFKGVIPVSGINLNPEKKIVSFSSMKIKSDVLKKIDSIVNQGIQAKAFPGCQVFVSRYGEVVLDSSWGTLDGINPLKKNHLFDIASLTKIMASMPLLMKSYEEYGGDRFLDSPIYKLLPEFKGSPIGSILVKEVLAHQSGLPSWIPFYESFLWSDGSLDNRFFRSIKSHDFNTFVAPGIYAHKITYDSIFHHISTVKLSDVGSYKYSDLGYYLFQRFLERKLGKSLDQILHSQWYVPLGLNMTYLPLQNGYKLIDIAPTENDIIFRKQQIRGTVHDQGAAILGGVAGHAGLFANANSVGKMMQLYLNGGSANGYKYLNSKTIKHFTSCYSCETGNRRALGFDRPQDSGDGPTCGCVSPKSFGHTGFTGTFAWADPESGIILVFLSNRIYPNAENKKIYELDIRTKIQEVVQNSIY